MPINDFKFTASDLYYYHHYNIKGKTNQNTFYTARRCIFTTGGSTIDLVAVGHVCVIIYNTSFICASSKQARRRLHAFLFNSMHRHLNRGGNDNIPLFGLFFIIWTHVAVASEKREM